MLSNHQIRVLTPALTGLIVLVSLGGGLLLTPAFLYPSDEATATGFHPNPGHAVTSLVKAPPVTAQQRQGKTFTNNCAQCHAATNEVVVGPGLAGVTRRTPGEAWLLGWIRNSSAVASGDPYAVSLFNTFNKTQMASFPNLTDAAIRAILAYTDATGDAAR